MQHQLGRIAPRERRLVVCSVCTAIAKLSPLVVPAKAGTHNHGERFCEDWTIHRPLQHPPVVMGPCFRRDDEKFLRIDMAFEFECS
jgi:hypothetical protein